MILKKKLLEIAPKILKFAQPVWLKLDKYNNEKKKYYLKVHKAYY